MDFGIGDPFILVKPDKRQFFGAVISPLFRANLSRIPRSRATTKAVMAITNTQ